MAKDNRQIHSGIRIDNVVYLEGHEDELAEKLTPDDVKRLTDQGALSGDWVGKAKKPAEPAKK